MSISLQPPNRNPASSPLSANGSEWSGMNNYAQNHNESPYSPSVASFNYGDLISTPDSGAYGGQSHHQPNGSYGFPPNPGDIPHGRRRPSEGTGRQPSPPISIANSRSSDGTISDNQSRKYRRMEYELSQHYNILKQYLRGGPPPGQRPNKARDKLLRLSPVQFHELSTDVFDELQRRQASTPLPGRPAQRRENVPPFLHARPDFHEKRNQARQKLSSLQTSRFRDLSTDVFQELERRFPVFADPNRQPGPRAGSRGPGGPGFVPPPRTHSHSHSRGQSQQSARGMNNGGPYDGPGGSDYGRPMPKQFQSNTITPNKSTMVEDDDGVGGPYDRSSDAFGLESALGQYTNRDTSATSRSGNSSQKDVRAMENTQNEMQQRIDELEVTVRSRDDQIRRLESRSRSNESGDSTRLQQDLQRKADEAEQLNRSLRDELDRLHSDQVAVERDLRSQLDEVDLSGGSGNGWKAKHDHLQQQHQDLQDHLEQQRRVVDEVRKQATEHLAEMRAMADGSGGNFEREEKLHHDVQRLKEEVKEWKARYATTKTQLRNARASSLGLSISRPDIGRTTRDDSFRHEQGLVKDVHITKFQISVDELLKVARTGEPASVLDYMKAVVIAVRSITNDIDLSGPANKDDEVSKRRVKLKAKVSATANNVITACKNFAQAGGISPVSLLDAAASHLTAAVVDLVRTVKIRPTPPGELDDDDDTTLEPMPPSGYFNVADMMRRRSAAAESVYSALSTPTETNGHRQSGQGRSVHSRSASRNDVGLDGAVKSALGNRRPDEAELEELKNYLEEQTEHLVESIQSLVGAIRTEEKLPIVRNYLTYITDVVDNVVSATEGSWEEAHSFSDKLRRNTSPITGILRECKRKLLQAGVESRGLEGVGRQSGGGAGAGAGRPAGQAEVREFVGRLPPLAFEIARETKQLVQRVEELDNEEEVDGDGFVVVDSSEGRDGGDGARSGMGSRLGNFGQRGKGLGVNGLGMGMGLGGVGGGMAAGLRPVSARTEDEDFS